MKESIKLKNFKNKLIRTGRLPAKNGNNNLFFLLPLWNV